MDSKSNFVSVHTRQKQELINLTTEVQHRVDASGIRTGLVGIYSQHTTAALFISESQAALSEDVLEFLGNVVQDGLPYKHNSPEFSDCDRKNAASHLRSVLLNHSVMVPVVDGKPVLGQFQSIMFAELDGPRDRTVHIQVLGQ
jgi:secondary thiamine-phosphate synthase enzyme